MPRVTFGNFSLEAPDEWTLSTVILAGPVSEDLPEMGLLGGKTVRPFQSNMIVTMERVGPEVTPESYVRRQLEGLREAGVDRRDARTPEKVQLENGIEGLLTEQVILAATGERVHQMQLVCIKNEVAHTIIGSHLDGAPFEAVRDEFRKMLLSFK
jgi:hypothetical protein